MFSSSPRRPVIRFLFAALFLLPLVSLNASTKLFLLIDKIPGESTDKGFEKQIEVFSFSWGSMNTGTARSGGAAAASRPDLSDLAIMKRFDLSSPALLAKLLKGEVIPKVTLTAVKAGKETLVPVLVLELTNVVVSSLQESDSAGGDITPSESVSFNYDKLKLTYIAADGSKSSTEWSTSAVK